ncbi:MAG: DUF177 domain-containing protein [Actinobacteria bacterium]|nr:DUF177 domain-containing protein [Actinomycetota bacterium]
MPGFRIDVADLLSHPGARREVTLTEPVEGLVGTSARVEGPVTIGVTLDRISDGIVAHGMLGADWHADCSRCLEAMSGRLEVPVDELFEPTPVEGETYPIVGHEIDLEQLIRDSVLLELPLAPHCEPPCEPAFSPPADDDVTDPRWAALSELEL